MSPGNIRSGTVVSQCCDVASGEAERFLERAGWRLSQSEQDERQADVTIERSQQLRFIGIARALGYDLHECQALMALLNCPGADRSCADGIDADFMRQLAAVDDRIVALMRPRGALLRLRADRRPMVGGIASVLTELNGSAHE
jgi:hypothetical protein